MQKRVYIVSLNFNPGHVSHMIASYQQFAELGYLPYLYVDKLFDRFLPVETRRIFFRKHQPKQCAVAMFLFPSFHNLKEILRFKRMKGCKIIYVFHEPLDKYSSYRKAGFSRMKMLKLRIINYINCLTVKWSDQVLLPSQRAVKYYEANPLYTNVHWHYLPLLYDDENDGTYMVDQRLYFSYIGTVASDHSFNAFLQFVRRAIRLDDLKDIKFLIATKSSVPMDDYMQEMIRSGRLVLVEGKPLSNAQINQYYASSLAVWNTYERTTQSGVLANAFMFGTPAIVMKKNLSEFVEDGNEVIAIEDNRSYDEILHAIQLIRDRFEDFSVTCRTRFLNTFYYRNYNQEMERILC